MPEIIKSLLQVPGCYPRLLKSPHSGFQHALNRGHFFIGRLALLRPSQDALLWVPVLWLAMAARGGLYPSWLARCALALDRRVLRSAWADSAGARGALWQVELLLQVAAIVVFCNLYLGVGAAAQVTRELLGLDADMLQRFLAFGSSFFLLVTAAVALVVVEPLRAICCAVALTDARARHEAFDLAAAVERALADGATHA